MFLMLVMGFFFLINIVNAISVEISASEFLACFIEFEQVDGAFLRAGFRPAVDEVSSDCVVVFVGDMVG